MHHSHKMRSCQPFKVIFKLFDRHPIIFTGSQKVIPFILLLIGKLTDSADSVCVEYVSFWQSFYGDILCMALMWYQKSGFKCLIQAILYAGLRPLLQRAFYFYNVFFYKTMFCILTYSWNRVRITRKVPKERALKQILQVLWKLRE